MPAGPFHEQDPVGTIPTGFLGAERVHPVLDARDIEEGEEKREEHQLLKDV